MFNSFSQRLTRIIQGTNAKSGLHKFKASFFAIIIGLVVGAIPILATGGDVLNTYVNLFTKPFSKIFLNGTLITSSAFIILGIGIGISFKTGLFNIGASGQFLVAGAVTTMMGISLNLNKGISIPLLLVISFLVGALVAAFAGFLKAFFNIHEVVSTILLNWSLFYAVKSLFKMDWLRNTSNESSKFIHKSMGFSNSDLSHDKWIIVAIAITVAFLIWAFFKFSTLGFQFKANGLNADAAKYAGINTKKITIYSMALSGGFCGVAGFIIYSSLYGQLPALGSSLPNYGFEAITVTLLAFTNPIGAIPAGIFYGVIKTGIPSASILGHVTSETLELVLAAIIIFAALAPILVEIKPIRYLSKYYFSLVDKEVKTKRALKKQIIFEINAEFKKSKLEILPLKKDGQNVFYQWYKSKKTNNLTAQKQQEFVNQYRETYEFKLKALKQLKHNSLSHEKNNYKLFLNSKFDKRKEVIK